MKRSFPVSFAELRRSAFLRSAQFLTGPVNKEMQEAKPTRKKKATKKSLKLLAQHFAK